MHHLSIAKKKHTLALRAHILHALRSWFVDAGFVEIEAPIVVQKPGMEPYLSPVPMNIHNEAGSAFSGHLITSPEYTMKKCLAAGMNRIFCLGKVFRDYESFGGSHNPEFTMLEWYRANADMHTIMDDVEVLCKNVFDIVDKPILPVERIHMNDLWKRHTHLELHTLLTQETMLAACRQKGYDVREDEPYEDLFYRIFLNEIEPNLPKHTVTIVHHYPAQMAALAKISEEDPRYAERFEVYVGNIELANAFTELTDPVEQRERIIKEQNHRKNLGKPIYDIDEDFISAVGAMPPAAGIALGVDRLVQLAVEAPEINDTLVLSAKDLFANT